MKFTKEDVFQVAEKYALIHRFPPKLIKALCLQEGDHSKDGTFNPDVARLEQGFYRKYVEQQSYATTSEVLLAASYGVMQLMGQSLLELGYFEYYFNSLPVGMQTILKNPRTPFAICNAIDAYCVSLDLMIDWGCKHLRNKFTLAHNDLHVALLFWNGGSNKAYPSEVIAKMNLV